jgi:regulator of protease activity HflC (stomatin/prohibitin superfamily)
MIIEILIGLLAFFFITLLVSLVIVRPTHRALVERLGKYNRFIGAGLHARIPILEKVYQVNITERMVDAEPQQVITQDNLNAEVDAQIYYKVKPDEESVKKCQYNVMSYQYQIVNLARTTLRDIIGKMPFKDVNSKRDVLNDKLAQSLKTEVDAWGIEIVRAELKEIEPPEDVQETMNKVLKAENEKVAAIDFATARETEADGIRRANIKEASGEAEAVRLRARAEADAVKMISESAEKYFKSRAEAQRKLEVVERVMASGVKYVVPANSELLTILPLSDGAKNDSSSGEQADDIVNSVMSAIDKKYKKGQ